MAGKGKPGPEPGTTRKPPNSGGSRLGKPNKVTKALKEMILGALDAKGGEDWLIKQMDENPSAFLTLLGKVLPTTLTGDLTINGALGEAIQQARERLAGGKTPHK